MLGRGEKGDAAAHPARGTPSAPAGEPGPGAALPGVGSAVCTGTRAPWRLRGLPSASPRGVGPRKAEPLLGGIEGGAQHVTRKRARGADRLHPSGPVACCPAPRRPLAPHPPPMLPLIFPEAPPFSGGLAPPGEGPCRNSASPALGLPGWRVAALPRALGGQLGREGSGPRSFLWDGAVQAGSPPSPPLAGGLGK